VHIVMTFAVAVYRYDSQCALNTGAAHSVILIEV